MFFYNNYSGIIRIIHMMGILQIQIATHINQ